jgi:hypothetical protein
MTKGKKDKKKDRKGSAVPRTVGGVKLPKPVRKAGKAALKAAQDPAVSEAVAAALLGAAAALREGKGLRDGAKAAGVAATDAVEEATREMSGLASSLRAIAIDVARKTIDAWAASGGDERTGSSDGEARGGRSRAAKPAAAGAESSPRTSSPGRGKGR